MVSLCAELGIQVISEGIETPAERDALIALGADLQQGFLYGLPSESLAEPQL